MENTENTNQVEINVKTVGELIKHYRTEVLHKTQEEFADYANASPRTIQYWESGERTPHYSSLENIFSENIKYLEIAKLLKKSKNNITNMTAADFHETNQETYNAKNVFELCEKINDQPYKVYGESLYVPCKYNTVVFATPSTGKYISYIRPNLLANKHSNYLIKTTNVDDILKDDLLKGFDVRVLDFSPTSKGDFHYNPLENCYDTEDIKALANTIVKSSHMSNDPFWEQSEILLLSYFMLYTWIKYSNYNRQFRGKKKCNLISVYNMLISGSENDIEKMHCDIISVFEQVSNLSDPSHGERSFLDDISKTIDVMNEIKERLSMIQNKVIKSVYISLAVTLQPLTVSPIAEMISDDNLKLYNYCLESKQAVIIKDVSCSVSFLYNCLITTMLTTSRLFSYSQEHLKIILDNTNTMNSLYIPQLDKLMATVRKYKTSVDIIVPSMGVLKVLSPNGYDNIIASSNVVYMGSVTSEEDAQYISSAMGTYLYKSVTLDVSQGAVSGILSGKSVFKASEFLNLSISRAIVSIQGYKPVIVTKAM